MNRADSPVPVTCPHCRMRQMRRLDREQLHSLLERGHIALRCANDKCDQSWIWQPEQKQLENLRLILNA